MKFISKIILPCIAVGMIAVACNDIEPAERFIEMPAVESNRVVLLEDYTGQNCKACPAAHTVMEQLLEQYPDQLVCVSIHSGPFAYSAADRTYGLKQDFGDGMASDRGLTQTTSYPKGVIDGGEPEDYNTWATSVRQALEKPSYCEIAVSNLAVTDGVLTGEIIVTPGSTFSGNLGIWVIEDGIVARQNDDGVWNMQYVHNHVMRAYASASVWGDAIDLTRDEDYSREFSCTLNEKWNAENLSVVAFVTNAENGEYVQTVQASVSK